MVTGPKFCILHSKLLTKVSKSPDIVFCISSKGFISVTSDSVSSVSILQDFITKSATKKKSKFDIQQQFHESTVISTLKLIDPKLQEHIDLQAKYDLLIALLDIQTLDAGCDTLIPEYQQILRDEKNIKQQYKKQTNLFKHLCKAVMNLYLDWHKHKGVNVKGKLPQLESILNSNYSLDNVIQFFDL
ncbi:Bardet-Biedl syndrome 7 protein homolog isoform X2 [Diaphorina citri]|uniref:Bardet-Biedl syndrome 7 protein homolog isoform X2 n=1 Tax=Diaphorina citri TaxID=121845 RepID=A0A3Q0JDD2_DIACI|nr:Bardet-Biedl syndrome 7 protein homolog isoform X2 [Diaphorina citri]